MEDLYRNAINFLSKLDLFLVFTITAILLIAFTVIELFLIYKKGNKNKILTHLFISVGLILIISSLSLVNDGYSSLPERFCLPLLLSGLCFITYIPVLLVAPKRPIINDEQLNFAKFLDGVVHKPVQKPALEFQPVVTKKVDEPEPERIKAQPKPQAETCKDIDFTHVKNVAERLNYYNLSVTDKRTVTDLLSSVAQAETGDFTPELQSKINDYLGMLLKLMSKYNV